MEYIDSGKETDATTAVGDVVGPVAEQTSPHEGRSKRGTFSVDYKRRVVAEYDAAPKGSKGVVLRREGLYGSHIQQWRAAIAAGTLQAPLARGRPRRTGEQARIAELERQVTRLEGELRTNQEVIAARDEALDVLGRGVAFLEALSSRNAR